MSRSNKPMFGGRSHVADWERTQKPRVWRGQVRLLLIVLLSIITYISLPAMLYYTIRLAMDPGQQWDTWAIGSLIAFVSSLVMGIILSTLTKCSLCHGTPLLSRKCRKHTIANKLPFLSYRASAVLHILFTGKFRCMYCSTPFRLGRKQ